MVILKSAKRGNNGRTKGMAKEERFHLEDSGNLCAYTGGSDSDWKLM